MLLWQPKKHNQLIFLGNFFLCVLVVHLLLLMPLFMISMGQEVFRLQINLNKTNRYLPVVFVPLGQEKPRSLIAGTSAKMQTVQQKVIPAAKPKEPIKTTLMHKVPAKKNLIKKTQPVKKEVVKKEPIKKAEPAKAPVSVAKEAPKQQEAAQLRQEIDALYVNRAELEQLAIADYLQQEVGTHWRPPVGLSADLACTVKICVDYQGSVTQATIAESSGVVIYDVAVQAALMLVAKLPAWAYNKEFFINFKH